MRTARLSILALFLVCQSLHAGQSGRQASQGFIVYVPPKIEVSHSDDSLRFRSTVPILISATRSTPAAAEATSTVFTVWQHESQSIVPTTVSMSELMETSSGMITLTIVPLH